jgi:hypothetical protein
MQSYRFNAGREHLPDIVTDFWKGVYHFFTGLFPVSVLRLGIPPAVRRVDKTLNGLTRSNHSVGGRSNTPILVTAGITR